MRSAGTLVVMVLAGFAVAACGNGDDTTSPNPAPIPDAASDATKDAAKVGGDASTGADAEAEAANETAPSEPTDAPTFPPVASLRMANWSPDAPGIDFCIAPHGTTAFEGPILANHGSSGIPGGGDAGTAALPFPGLSSYFSVPPGQYDARLVAAGAANCSTKIVADFTAVPKLLADGAATVALVGQVGGGAGLAGLHMIGLADDTATAEAVGLRFINAVPNPSVVDVWIGTGASAKPLFLGIPFGTASSLMKAQFPALVAMAGDAATPTVDSNGYELLTSALVGATFSARFAMGDAGGEVVSGSLSSAVGATLTVAILPLAAGALSDAGRNAQLLECVDNAGTVGLFGNCSVISQ